MNRWLKHITEFGWAIGSLLLLTALLLWIPDFIAAERQTVQLSVTLGLSIVNSLMLMQLAYQSNVIRTRTMLPIVLYLLTVGATRAIHTDWQAQVVVLLLQLIVLLEIRAYRKMHATEEGFLIGLLTSVAALLMPDFMALLLLFWLCLAWQRAISHKTIIASMIGIATVGIYFGLMVYFDWFDMISWSALIDRSVICPKEDVFANTIMAIALIIYFFTVSISMLSHTAVGQQSFVILVSVPLLVLLPLSFFPLTGFAPILAVLCFALSALATFCFANRQSIALGISFIAYIVLHLTIYILQLIF